MKKISLLSTILCLCLMPASAQVKADADAKKTYSFPLTNEAKSVSFFENALYYNTAENVFNNTNRSLCTATEIHDFKISPSGSSYAVLSGVKKKREVKIYNLSKEETVISTVKGIKYKPVALCYTSNARELMVAGADSLIHCYDAITGKPASATMRTLDVAEEMKVSTDGRFMAVRHGNEVELWNMVDRVRRTVLNINKVKQTELSNDGNILAALTTDGELAIYDTRTLTETKTIDGLGEALAFSIHPEGKHIAVATSANRIAIINQVNPADREYLDAKHSGINNVNFVKNSGTEQVFLLYTAKYKYSAMGMNYLSPFRSKLIADMLQEKMDEWTKLMPGESLEDYSLRVNDDTRAEHLKKFSFDIATQMAMDDNIQISDVKMGNYNPETKMLEVSLGGNMGDIYLNVESSELPMFMETSNIEFRNAKYALNELDEYELVYADVYNRATGKTYTYNNMEGQFLDYLTDDANSTPIELIQQTMMEEGGLADLKEQVMAEAKDENLITDHTNIQVKTRIVPAVGADGSLYQNYNVGVSYTVDQEFSARDDYAPGKYKIEESNAGMAMLTIVKKALEGDFAKYVVPGKRLKVRISGTADASPIHGVIKYDGCYGDFTMQPIYNKGALSNVTVQKATGITDNNQLAFMRAVGVHDFFTRELPQLNDMQVEYEYDIAVSEQEGSEFRKIGVDLTFENAF